MSTASGDINMKRFFAIIIMICLASFSFSCFAAQGDFYCSYTAKTENGTLFYIDVFCAHKVAAAVFELGFDSGLAEYREVSAADPDDHVSADMKKDKVTFAFASGEAKSGKLCRITFNGISSGDCLFDLHMDQACDGDYNYISGLSDQTLSVRLGKEGKISGSSSSVTSTGSNPSEKSGSKSSDGKTVKGDKSEMSSADDNASKSKGGLYDLRKNDPLKYVLLGAGGVVLIGALIFTGYMLGRKRRAKENAAEDNSSASGDTPEDEMQE